MHLNNLLTKPILTIIFIITLFSAKAQQTANTPYYTDPELKKFAGEWQTVFNDTTFSINLKFVKTYVKAPGNFYVDNIQGEYTMTIGSKLLLSSVDRKAIRAGSYADRNINKDQIHFLFYDLGKKSKSGRVIFELLNGKDDVASWTLTNPEGVHIGHYDYSFSVPVKAVFKRVK